MKSASTFTSAGWDFETIWDIGGTTNDGYPFLLPYAVEIPVITVSGIGDYSTPGSGASGLAKTYAYDARGRLAAETLSFDGESYVTEYEYNSAGQLTFVTYPTGETVYQSYNERQMPYQLTGGEAGILAEAVEYNQHGLVTRIELGNGLDTTFSYHGLDTANDTAYGLPYEIKTSNISSTIQDEYFDWDEAGNLTGRENVLDDEAEEYEYDFLDRLTGVTGAYTESFAYDEIGNLTSKDGLAYSYGTKPHAVTQVGAVSYAYDANGNMTQRGTQSISWDNENRPLAVNDEGNYSAFAYDAGGDRILKIENGETVLYVNPYYEKNLSTGVETSYYYLGGSLIAKRTGQDETYDLTYFHQDHLGSTTAMTDGSGDQLASQKYLPFGSYQVNPNELTSDKLFTGQRLDSTGLYYYNARYYDAELGRFISADSIVQNPANPQNLNRYSYCLNNPLKYTDPSGEIVWLPILFAAAIGAASGAAFYTGEVVVTNAIQGDPLLDDWSWGEFGLNTGIGAATGGVLKVPGMGRFAGKLISPAESYVSKLAHPLVSRGYMVSRKVGQMLYDAGLSKYKPKSIEYLRRLAVQKAWKQEAELMRKTGSGTYEWSETEIRELLATGKVKDFIGHHVRNVAEYPEWAGNPANIQFVSRTDHMLLHGNNWRLPTWGRLIWR